MRRTRILVTIGPASDDPESIQALVEAGADAIRLNFSHGSRATHATSCERIRAAAARAGRDVAILQDLAGPKIRIGALTAPIPLAVGDRLVIERGDFVGEAGRVSSTFEALFTSIPNNQRLLVDDGRIELVVTAAEPGRLTTEVRTGGLLEARKGINVPGVTLRTSSLGPGDVEDLRAGIAMGVDVVAVSFVQSADDVLAARAAAGAAGAPDVPIIAKIEKPQAIAGIDQILDVADGLMVARGDLGVEIPLETVPSVQKRLVKASRRRGVPVIVATEVLGSMRTELRPTRAEVTDAAHAVDQRVDTIMLAGETAVGRHPVRATAMLDRIIREAESVVTPPVGFVPDGAGWSEHGRALCEAAVTTATRVRADIIVALTRTGRTARLLAAMRPAARILAVTPSRATAARLMLVWGIVPVVLAERGLAVVREALVERRLVPPGAVIVLVSAHAALGHEDTNFLHVERV
jgi:pyruvate kinase